MPQYRFLGCVWRSGHSPMQISRCSTWVHDIGAQIPFSPTQKVPETVTSQSKVRAKHHLLTQQSNPLAVRRAKSATSQPESCYFITCCTFQSDRDTLDQPGGDYLVKEISEIQGEIDWKHYSVGAGHFYPTKFLLSLVACAYYTWFYWNIDQKLPITFHWVVNKVCCFFFLVDFSPKIKQGEKKRMKIKCIK